LEESAPLEIAIIDPAAVNGRATCKATFNILT